MRSLEIDKLRNCIKDGDKIYVGENLNSLLMGGFSYTWRKD